MGEGFALQGVGLGLRGGEAVDGDVGELALGGILARRLAQAGRVGGGIEHVIGDLEGEADGFAEGFEQGSLGTGGAAGQGSQDAAGADQRGGLAAVDAFEAVGVMWRAFGIEVFLLTADHAEGAGGMSQGPHRLDAMLGGAEEGQRLQRVAGEDGGGLIEGLMAGGPAAPQVVVVHRRQIIVDQGVGVEHLDRRHGPGAGMVMAADRAAGRQHQRRAQAFAAGEHAVTHRFVQPAGRGRHQRQAVFERGIGQDDRFAQQGFGPVRVGGGVPRT